MTLDVWLYGVFAFEILSWVRVAFVPFHEIARTPFAVNLGILGALLVPFIAQRNVRGALIVFSIGCLLIMTGLVMTGAYAAACLIVFFLSRYLHRWSNRTGDHTRPLLVGWLVINTMYLPTYFLLPPALRAFTTWGEIVLFWGAAFAVLRSIHYVHRVCKQDIDPHAPGAFGAYLHYLVHFPSFWFGPYQRFDQFTSEVATCKERLSWRNTGKGLWRITLGSAKMIFVFFVFNYGYLYDFGYFGPFVDKLFEDASSADPGHLWLASIVFILRITIFISAISDGVIGMNLMMGIRVPENSRWPLFAPDILEFWRRWHIQAGLWLREEIFFPMGGLRKPIFGFACVFAYSGFWHFPSASAVLAFPALHVGLIWLTMKWQKFWKEHRRKNDWIHHAGLRWKLHDSWISGLCGMTFIFFVNIFSGIMVHDHFYSNTRIIPRMFGW